MLWRQPGREECVSVTEVKSLTVNTSVLLVVWSLGEADGDLVATVADRGLTGIVFVCRETRKEVE